MATRVSTPTTDLTADDVRRRGLRRMRTVAVSLLLVAAVVFLATLGQDGALGFVNAGAEASMVGAIADWFAVTALFRHPLGLPIPHTALIPRRKDDLGKGLEDFVGENFLQEDIIRERIGSARIAERVGVWLGQEANARKVVDEVADVAAIALGKVRDDHIASLVNDALVPRFRDEPISPLLGGLLGEALRDDLHHGLVDLALEELYDWLRDNPRTVQDVIGERAPWWAPESLNERVTARIHLEMVRWVGDIRSDPHHRARLALDTLLDQLSGDLLHDPDTQQRAERLKDRLLDHPAVISSGISLWNALQRALTTSLRDPAGGRPSAAAGRGAVLRRSVGRRRRSPRQARHHGCGRRGLRRRALRHRGDGRDHPHHRALGRPRGRRPDRAARRPRPPVHPDQRHDRGRSGGGAHPPGLGSDSLNPMADPVNVSISDDSIKLGQFLKLANLVESGSDAKALLTSGMVRVNGQPETRRGRQLVNGDLVSVASQSARVSDGSTPDDFPW